MVDTYPILRFSLKILQLPENKNRENGQLALKFSLISITKNRSMRYFGILGRDTLKWWLIESKLDMKESKDKIG